MNPELIEKLKDAKYFVCSDAGTPIFIKFTWINARKTKADYIDAFDYVGKPIVSVRQVDDDGTYSDEF